MPSGRTRLAEGVYLDDFGISVAYCVHGQRFETRFPRDSSLDRLTAWRASQIALVKETVAPTPARGTLARDAVRFLKTRKGRPNYKTEKANLKAWITALGNPLRRRISRQQVQTTLAHWRQTGYSEQTLRHRCLILRALCRFFDGPRAPSLFDDLPLPKKSRPRPVSVSDALIRSVAVELVKHEIVKWLKDAKTRARFLVLASTGRRPSELKRAQRSDVDLDRRLWAVRTGKGGPSTVLYLNDDMRAAWALFIQSGAWGSFDTRNFARVLQRCGWPKGIRPYTLRHSTGLALSEAGADLGDIQAHLGHASIDTTRTYYVPAIDSRRQQVSELLDGRLGPSVFTRPTSAGQTSAKGERGRERARLRTRKSESEEPEKRPDLRKKR